MDKVLFFDQITGMGVAHPGGGSENFDANIWGGKGAGLREMAQAGYPVPPGFVIPIYYFHKWKETLPNIKPKFMRAIWHNRIKAPMTQLLKSWGDTPALPMFSIRSGAPVSMPGMMDSVLNVGLTEDLDVSDYPNYQNLLMECLKRFILSWKKVVEGEDKGTLDGVEIELESMVSYEGGIHLAKELGVPVKLDAQVMGVVQAVFESWFSDRAVEYRFLNKIDNNLGTAVVFQKMVFGNLNDESCTGVIFTRNPDTGENTLYGEYLINAQGDEIVAGTHTPKSIHDEHLPMVNWDASAYHELLELASTLEEDRGDVQDIEFTVEDGTLYLLQTRSAKRTPRAAFRIAWERHNSAGLNFNKALESVSYEQYKQLSAPVVKTKAPWDFEGIAASGGVVQGNPAVAAEGIEFLKKKGGKVIFVAKETCPNDIKAMSLADGIITMHGGMTSHAAVVSRQLGKPCIVGVGAQVSEFLDSYLTLDCNSGRIWKGDSIMIVQSCLQDQYAWKLLTKYAGLKRIPVIQELSEQLTVPQSEVLYVKITGSSITDSAVTQMNMCAQHVDSIVLDFRGLGKAAYHGKDSMLMEVVSAGQKPHLDKQQDAADAIKNILKFVDFDKNKVFSVVDEGVAAPTYVVPVLDSVKDLVNAKGPLFLTDTSFKVLNDVIPGMLKLHREAGRPTSILNTASSMNALAAQALGK